MIHLCSKCDRVIRDGDRVTVEITSVYHLLKSSVAYALDKASLEAHGDTLRHENCDRIEGD